MQTQPKRLEQIRHYRELELIPTELYLQQTQPQKQTGWLKAIACWLADWVTPSTEPRIYQKVDARGLAYWKVFDPVTGEGARLHSVNEVHTWLEQRYRCQESVRSVKPLSLDSMRVYPFRF